MKVNFSSPILDLSDKPIVQDDKPLTLGAICAQALLQTYADERDLSGDKKVARFKLAQKATSDAESDLTAEDVVEIKKVVAKLFGPLAVARAFELLDPSK